MEPTTCERYNLEMSSLDQSLTLQNYYQQNEEFLKFVASKAGYEISSNNIRKAVKELGQIYDILLIEVSTY